MDRTHTYNVYTFFKTCKYNIAIHNILKIHVKSRFCLCSDGSVRFRLSVERFDRRSRWSQFAFFLDRSLESSIFCDVVHNVLLRCRFGGETLVFLVRYQYHFLHGRGAFSLSRLFIDFLPKTLITFLYFFSLFLSDGDMMTLPLMTL